MYPIGTKLYTSRASQIALYGELFGEEDVKSFLSVTEQWAHGIFYQAALFQVTVTEANQKWLSPMPIVGDLCFWKIDTPHDKEGGLSPDDVWDIKQPCVAIGVVFPAGGELLYYYNTSFIEKRTYPNGQRAPMIEWDKVELPTEEMLST